MQPFLNTIKCEFSMRKFKDAKMEENHTRFFQNLNKKASLSAEYLHHEKTKGRYESCNIDNSDN